MLTVNVAGIDHPVTSVSAQNGDALVQIVLSKDVATGDQQPVTVTYDGSKSEPFNIPIR